MINRIREPLVGAALVALFAVAAFLPILKAEFVWDDNIVQTMQIPFLPRVGDAFRPPHGALDSTHLYYRPVVLLSYQLDEALNNRFVGPRADAGGDLPEPLRARIPHAATLLCHALASVLAYLTARRLLHGAGVAALVAGAFFALSPSHVETVCAVAGRGDSLATLFLLTGLLLALAASDRKSPVLAACSLPAFFLALLSKEVALAAAPLLALCLWLSPARTGDAPPSRSRWWLLASPLLAAAAYLALRRWAASLPSVNVLEKGLDALPPLLKALGFYARKLLLPWPHEPYVPELPGWGLALAALAALGALAGGALWWRRRAGDGLPLLCVLWAGLALAPSLLPALQEFAATPVAERYLYLPSVGVALGAGLFFREIARRGRKPLATAACAALLVAFGISSWTSAAVWRDDVALWSRITGDAATSGHVLPWGNLGTAHYVRGDLAKAEEAFHKALEAPLGRKTEALARAWNGLGNVSFSRAQVAFFDRRLPLEALPLYREAETQFARAAGLGMPIWAYPKNLAQARLMQLMAERTLTGVYRPELLARADEAVSAALRLNPSHPEILRLAQSLENYRRRAASP